MRLPSGMILELDVVMQWLQLFIIVSIFKVDDNSKINRLCRMCPAEECGAGVFMAAHFNRQVPPTKLWSLNVKIFYELQVTLQ